MFLPSLQDHGHGDQQDSQRPEPQHQQHHESFEETPLWIAVLTYLGYGILILFGHFRDLLRKWKVENVPMAAEPVLPVSKKFRDLKKKGGGGEYKFQ